MAKGITVIFQGDCPSCEAMNRVKLGDVKKPENIKSDPMPWHCVSCNTTMSLVRLSEDDVLTEMIIDALESDDPPSFEDLIDMILVERRDWSRDWAVDLLEKTERVMRLRDDANAELVEVTN